MEAHNKQKRIKLIDHAMHLWRNRSEEYRTKIDTYLALLEEKRRLRIQPLNAIKKSMLNEYPCNEFLSKSSEDEARRLLESLSDQEIQKVLDKIYDIWNTDYTFVTLNARIIDFRYQIKHYGEKNKYSYNPDTMRISIRKKAYRQEED